MTLTTIAAGDFYLLHWKEGSKVTKINVSDKTGQRNVTSVADRTTTTCRTWPNTYRLNSVPLCCFSWEPQRSSLQGILWMSPFLTSWTGGGCPSPAFPSWIIIALGVNPNFPCSASTLPPLSQVLIWVQWGLAEALSCSAHTHKSSWARSVNSGKRWMCRPTVKSPSRVIYCWELVCPSSDSPVHVLVRHFPLRDPCYKLWLYFAGSASEMQRNHVHISAGLGPSRLFRSVWGGTVTWLSIQLRKTAR